MLTQHENISAIQFNVRAAKYRALSISMLDIKTCGCYSNQTVYP